jgi:hypothetical protein
VLGLGASRTAFISSRVRWLISRSSVRLFEIARIWRVCSSAEGTSYSTYFINERMAVRRRFLVREVLAAVPCEMLQIRSNHLCIEILEGKRRGGLAESIADVTTQALERIAVVGKGVLGNALLNSEMIPERGGDEGGKWCHGLPPLAKSSQRSAIFEKSAGVTLR